MRVGSRESKLAMRQTEIFCQRMAILNPEEECQVIGIKSLGDIDLTSPLNQMSATGAFVRELDEAILKGSIDVSVNSLKDIPTVVADGLTVGAILKRDSDEDVMLPCSIDQLPQGAKVGTASVRREMMLREIRPDLEIVPLRGNIHTRLSKLDRGEFDAIILAKAGLDRMGIERPMHILDKQHFIPAPAQGAIAVECRSDDPETLRMISAMDDYDTRVAVEAERRIMRIMKAGCSAPVGINAVVVGDELRIMAVSYSYTPEPRRLKITVAKEPSDDELVPIAEYLTGRRDSI